MQNNKNILNQFPRWLIALLGVTGGIILVVGLFVGATIVAAPILLRQKMGRERDVYTKWELPERRKKGPCPSRFNQAWPY